MYALFLLELLQNARIVFSLLVIVVIVSQITVKQWFDGTGLTTVIDRPLTHLRNELAGNL